MSDPREAELLRVIQAQRQRLDQQKKEIEQQALEIKILRQKLDALARRIFGKSSEKLDRNQLELLLKLQGEEDLTGLTPGKGQASSDLDEEADPEHPAKKRRPFGRKERWPLDLPVVVQVIDPEEVKQAPEAWRQIGEEVSEQLDYEPAQFFRRRLIRRKYVARLASGCGTGHRAAAACPARALHRRSRAAGGDHRGEVLRSSSALPSGRHLPEPPPGHSLPAEHEPVDGDGGRLVEAHL